VTSYAEMDRLRKLARPLYLELCALGLDVWATERPDRPEGYEVHAGGMRSFSPRHADRLRQRIEEHTAGLVKVLWAKWDGDLEAIRREGAA
jgi:cytochrome P450